MCGYWATWTTSVRSRGEDRLNGLAFLDAAATGCGSPDRGNFVKG